MRPKDKMLIDCAAIDQAYAYLTKPKHLASVRVAGDVVELLTALEARDAEIGAFNSAFGNADSHAEIEPTMGMLREEVEELAASLYGRHEHAPGHELAQIAGIAINWLRRLDKLPLPRRDIAGMLARKDAKIGRLQTELDAKSDKLELAEFWWGQSADEARARALELVHGNNRLYDRCVDAVEERDEAREWANRRTRTANELYGCNTKLYNKAGDASKWTAVLSDEVSSLRSQLATASNDLRTQLTSALLERDKAYAQLAGVRDAYDTTVDIAVRARAQRDSARNDALDEADGAAHFAMFVREIPFSTIQAVRAAILSCKTE